MNSTKPITILMAEDHAVVRQGLCALLNIDSHFKIVGEARTGREAVAMAKTLRPDVILMDIAMPVLNGLEATRQILAANPAARIVILSAHTDHAYIERMTSAGVAGFLEKQTSAEILTKAIREVAAGKTYFSPSIAKRLLTRSGTPRDRQGLVKAHGNDLTPREREVLQLVTEGYANNRSPRNSRSP
ncbi:MAG: response regulator transcription factor [Lacunisphaera sp.]